MKLFTLRNYIVASSCDEQYEQYYIKILSLDPEIELCPCVVDKDALIEYEYARRRVFEISAYSDLYNWVTQQKTPMNVVSRGDIITKYLGNIPETGINHPDAKLKKLIAEMITPDMNSQFYYEASGSKVSVNPYRILRDSPKADAKLERYLRRLILAIMEKKSDKQLKEFLKVDTEYPEESRNYNNWLTNECITFDEKGYKVNVTKDEKELLDYAIELLKDAGYKEVTAVIDSKGIIKYAAKADKEIVGYIGQFFLPDNDGDKLIKTKYRVEETNYWFVPEYRAFLEKRGDNDNRSLEERTRLITYIQTIKNVLKSRLTRDIAILEDNKFRINKISNPTGVNWIYRKLYEERFAYNYLAEECNECDNALPLDIRKAIVETLAGKVKYSNFFCEGKYGINALVHHEENEYFCKGESIYLIDGTKGYFDPEATSSGKMQGSIRYLVSDTGIDKTGHIKPSKGRRAPIFEHEFLKSFSKYNPFDRNQMVFSNLMKAYRITEPEGTALMTCGGWNMEDGFVISKEFAEKYKVPDANNPGKLRSLKAGDKMLDRGGNKGVIAIVVDRDSTDKSIAKLVDVFKRNHNLHVIASPYSGLSRFNGATARELMESTEELDIDGRKYGNCIGKAQYIITRQFADKKTKIYDEEDYEEGNSRKASAQLSWALCSKDAKEMLRYFFKESDESKDILKEIASYVAIWGKGMNLKRGRARGMDPFGLNGIKKDDQEIDHILNSKNGYYLPIQDLDRYMNIYILPKQFRTGYIDVTGRSVESDITSIYRDVLLSNNLKEAKYHYYYI